MHEQLFFFAFLKEMFTVLVTSSSSVLGTAVDLSIFNLSVGRAGQ